MFPRTATDRRDAKFALKIQNAIRCFIPSHVVTHGYFTILFMYRQQQTYN
jgi:hypothetical protein